MDVQKILQWAKDNLSEYFAVFVLTLRNPIARFEPISDVADQSKVIIPSGRLHVKFYGSRLNPKLLIFLVISIFFGVTLNRFIPSRLEPPDLKTSVIVIFIYWFFYSTVLHWFCKLIGGRGSYWDILSVSLQLLGVLYVVSSFSALILGIVVNSTYIYNFLCSTSYLLEALADNPVLFFFIMHTLFMLLYLPLALRRVHSFGWIKQLLVAFIPPVSVFLSLCFYNSTHILQHI